MFLTVDVLIQLVLSLQGVAGPSSVNPAFQDAWSSGEDWYQYCCFKKKFCKHTSVPPYNDQLTMYNKHNNNGYKDTSMYLLGFGEDFCPIGTLVVFFWMDGKLTFSKLLFLPF